MLLFNAAAVKLWSRQGHFHRSCKKYSLWCRKRKALTGSNWGREKSTAARRTDSSPLDFPPFSEFKFPALSELFYDDSVRRLALTAEGYNLSTFSMTRCLRPFFRQSIIFGSKPQCKHNRNCQRQLGRSKGIGIMPYNYVRIISWPRGQSF
jgi:hypothetical protein